MSLKFLLSLILVFLVLVYIFPIILYVLIWGLAILGSMLSLYVILKHKGSQRLSGIWALIFTLIPLLSFEYYNDFPNLGQGSTPLVWSIEFHLPWLMYIIGLGIWILYHFCIQPLNKKAFVDDKEYPGSLNCATVLYLINATLLCCVPPALTPT